MAVAHSGMHHSLLVLYSQPLPLELEIWDLGSLTMQVQHITLTTTHELGRRGG